MFCNCTIQGEGQCWSYADVVSCQPSCEGSDCDKTDHFVNLATIVDCGQPHPPVDPVDPANVSSHTLFIILLFLNVLKLLKYLGITQNGVMMVIFSL